MGRHSAPDDDLDVGSDVGGDVVLAPPSDAPRPRPGRHSHAADDDEGNDSTAQIAPIVDPVLDEPLPAATTTVIVPVAEPVIADRPSDGGAGLEAGLVDDLLVAEPDPLTDVPSSDAKPAKPAKTKREKPPKAEKPKRPEPHVSDRTLLARDNAARARVIAAVVVPFVLYVAVLLVIDELDLRTALIWIWLPLITAGVMAGLILDLAHRAAAARAIEAVEDRLTDSAG